MKRLFPFVILVSIVVLIFDAFGPISSPDLFWHMKIGHDLLFKGLNPFVDHYSFTYLGAHQKDLTLPFDVLSALMYNFLSYFGIGLMRLLLWGLDLIVFVYILNKSRLSVLIKCFALSLLAFSITCRTEPRPELLSVPLELFMLILMERWQAGPTLKKSLGIFALLIVWANMHVSAAFGFLIVGAFMSETVGRSYKKKDWAMLRFSVLSGLIAFAVGWLNVDLYHPLLAPFHFDPRWRLYIVEFFPRDYQSLELPLKFFIIIGALSLPALVLLKRYGAALLVAGLIFENLQTQKILLHSIPIATPFIAIALQYYLDKFVGLRERKAVWVLNVFLALVIAANFITCYMLCYMNPKGLLHTDVFDGYFPVGVVKYMKDEKMKGRIYADYGLGGYVLFELAPDIKVFIDGRTNMVYPIEFFIEAFQASRNAKVLAAETKKYDIDYILTATDNVVFADGALSTGLFQLDYADSSNILLVRRDAKLPHTSHLLYHPECVLDVPDPRLAGEVTYVRDNLPKDSGLRTYLGFIDFYQHASDKAKIFEERHEPVPLAAFDRLAAHLAGRQKNWQAKLYYLDAMGWTNMTVTDQLDRIETFCHLDRCERVEKDINKLADVPMREDEKFRLAALMRQMKEKFQFKDISEAKYDKIQKYIQDYTKAHGAPSAPPFCEQ